MSTWDRAAVRNILQHRMEMDELRNLATDLGFEYEGLSKNDLALSLIHKAEKRQAEERLLNWLRQHRQDIDLAGVVHELDPGKLPKLSPSPVTVSPPLASIGLAFVFGLVSWFVAWWLGTTIAWGVSPAELTMWEETLGGAVGGAFGGFATLLYIRLSRGGAPTRSAWLVPAGWALGWGVGYWVWLVSIRSGVQQPLAALLGYLVAAMIGSLGLVVAGKGLSPPLRGLDGAIVFAIWVLAWGIQVQLPGRLDENVAKSLTWSIGGGLMFGWLAVGRFLDRWPSSSP